MAWGALGSIALNLLGPTIEKYSSELASGLSGQLGIPEDVTQSVPTPAFETPSQGTGAASLPRIDFLDSVVSKIGKQPGSMGRGRGGRR